MSNGDGLTMHVAAMVAAGEAKADKLLDRARVAHADFSQLKAFWKSWPVNTSPNRGQSRTLSRSAGRLLPKFPGFGSLVASLSLQTWLSPSVRTHPNDDAYQSIIFLPVTWAAIAFTKSS